MQKPVQSKSSKKNLILIWASIVLFLLLIGFKSDLVRFATEYYNSSEAPKLKVTDKKAQCTLVEFGMTFCSECKAMQEVLTQIKKSYPEDIAVIFADLSIKKYKIMADKFNIIQIPTQIIFNAEGEEIYRHTGFISFEDLSGHLIFN